MTHDYASYMAKGDISKVDDGKLKYADPKLVKPLEALTQFKKQGCVNPDASTHENNDANTYFTSGKAAMVQMFPFVIADFEKALGKNLGLARLPQSGPNAGRDGVELVPQLGDPEERGQPGRRVGVHQDGRGQQGSLGSRDQGRRTARRTRPRAAGLKDPLSKFFLQLSANPQVPLLDSVVPLKVALLYYQQLQAAFSGKTTPLKAMQNVDKGLKSLNP